MLFFRDGIVFLIFLIFTCFCSNIVSDVIRAQLELSRRVYRRLSKWSTPDDLETKLFGNVNGIIELLKSVESASAFGGDEKFFAEWRTSKARLNLCSLQRTTTSNSWK